MHKEIWKDILGYEEYYQISSFGRVKNKVTNKILKHSVGTNGYCHLTLSYKGKKDVLLHRLVADAFVDNPNNYLVVNHKDENKTNNNASNLEWCTTKYNVNYGNGALAKNSKVVQTDLYGNIISIYNSMKDAQLVTGIKYQLISACCRNICKTCGGYKWMYILQGDNYGR